MPAPMIPAVGMNTWGQDPNVAITEETLAEVRHVLAKGPTRAINTTTGLDGYDLAAPAQLVVPQMTPLVNRTPRKKNQGNTVHHFKSITNLGWNGTGTSIPGLTPEGSTSSQLSYTVLQLFNVFKTISTTQSLTVQARIRDRSLMGDLQAQMMSQLIVALKLTEENWLTHMSDYLWSLPTPLAPTTTTTGGTVAAGTYYVAVSAFNANGETVPTMAPAVITTTGTTSTISLTFFTEPNATGYNVYVGTATGAMYRQAAANYSTAAVPSQNVLYMAGNMSITLTSLTTSGTLKPTTNTAITGIDTGAGNIPGTFNGVMALIFGAGNSVYSSPNTAPSSAFTAAGTYANAVNLGSSLGLNTMTPHIIQPASSAGTLAYSDLDKLLLWMQQDSRADPNYLACSAQDMGTVTNILINSAGTRVNLTQTDNLANITANQRVTRFVNPYTGTLLDVEIWPFLPQGTIIAGSTALPYPVTGFDGPVMKLQVNQDYMALDFPPTLSNPVYAAQGLVDETLEISFLGGFGAITGIIPS